MLFVTAWAALGAVTEGYDPTRDPISHLAAVEATARPVMTASLVTLGVGMVLYSGALRAGLGGRAWFVALANGVATLGVAGLPLGSAYDTAHSIAAGLGYATLAAIPVVAAAPGHRGSRSGWATASMVTGIVSALCLLASVAGWRNGLFQRLGLTLAQAWVVASAISLARWPTTSSTTPPARGGAAPCR